MDSQATRTCDWPPMARKGDGESSRDYYRTATTTVSTIQKYVLSGPIRHLHQPPLCWSAQTSTVRPSRPPPLPSASLSGSDVLSASSPCQHIKHSWQTWQLQWPSPLAPPTEAKGGGRHSSPNCPPCRCCRHYYRWKCRRRLRVNHPPRHPAY